MDDLKAKFATIDKKTLIKFGAGFGAILIFLITSKSEKPNSLNWLIYPGLISWPGFIISNIIILFYLVRNILNKKLFLQKIL